MDAIFLQHFGGADALPGGGDLDQNPPAIDAGLFVQFDQGMALVDGALGVERQARVGFGGDAAGDDFQNFPTKGDQHPVDDFFR